jgi:NADPH:quinone reductase
MTQRIEVTRFGGPEVLVATAGPEPVAEPGQAVISVRAADVLFLDTLIRSGRAAQWFPVQPPYVPGTGVAGTVAATGAGLDPDWAGRRVIAQTGQEGGYTEQVAVPASQLIPVPDAVDLRDAAAVLHDGATALGLAAATGFQAGEWVLVLGAAGGLGLLLVQLARASGARVAGAARGPAKRDRIRAAGAEVVSDYSDPAWTEEILKATGGTGPDLVLDGAGGALGAAAFGITADGGRFSAHGAASGGFAPVDREEARRRGITVGGIEQVQFGPGEHQRFAERALQEVAAGRMTPVIGQTFALERAADAHAALENRSAIGKTLLTVAGAGG